MVGTRSLKRNIPPEVVMWGYFLDRGRGRLPDTVMQWLLNLHTTTLRRRDMSFPPMVNRGGWDFFNPARERDYLARSIGAAYIIRRRLTKWVRDMLTRLRGEPPTIRRKRRRVIFLD